MIYLTNKTLYNSIASRITKEDLRYKGKKITITGWMCKYFNDDLNLPEGTITDIKFKN